jgi:acyl-CoA synthetase (NDP forming)
VVVKICAASIPHKSEHGLVALGLVDAAEVRTAVVDIVRRAGEQFPASRPRGVLVQRMVTGAGAELVLGARRDPTFGPIVMVGLGGVFIEYLDDVALARAPVTPERAWRMLRSLRAFPLLDGARGRAHVDQDAIVDALVRLSQLAVAARERVSEIDVNPLIALPRGQGAVAVDGLLVLS